QPVSTAGGIEPRWSRDGKELFYYTGNQFPYTGNTGAASAVSMEAAGSSLTVGPPGQRAPRAINGTTSYSVAADGRFLMQTALGGGGRGFGGRPVGTHRANNGITFIRSWAR